MENTYWKSLDEKYRTPEFLKTLENEFQSSPLREEDGKDGLARRQFMKLMGASVALSAAACVRRPVQKIIPYNKQPGEIILDVPNYYASSFFDGTQGMGLLIKTQEGRPLHVAGHPGHPINPMGISARASAHLLSLYDPDRLQTPMINSVNPKNRANSISVKRTWDQIDAKVIEQLKKGSVAVLTSSEPSPHTSQLTEAFTSKFKGKKYVWDVFSTQTVRKAQKLCYGSEVVPRYHFDKAKYVLSIDGDFLGTYLSSVEYTSDFSKARKLEKAATKEMLKLVSFQSVPSLTTLNADDNYPLRASHQLGFAMALLSKVATSKGPSLPAELKKLALTDEEMGLPAGTVDGIVKALIENSGESIVIGGGLATEGDAGLSLQIAINWLNSLLGNEGKTVTAGDAMMGLEGGSDDLQALCEDIAAGKIKTLIIHNLNPLYTLPQSYKFAECLQKVEMLITTSNWNDETARLADVIAPSGHSMENWNELELAKNVYSLQQPTIRPLHDTRSFEDSLIVWSEKAGAAIASEPNFYEYLKNKVTKALGSENEWFEYLQKGHRGSLSTGSARGFNGTAMNHIQAGAPVNGLEMVLYPTVHMMDGTLSNVSWLLELPDPVTKVCWDNYLCVSPARAQEWKVKDGDVVTVKTDLHSVKAPVFIVPSMHKDVVAMAVGYGREAGGELHKNVGVNAFNFVKSEKGQLIYSGIPVEVTKTGETYPLAVTQGHNSMEGRQIVAETSFNNYKQGDGGVHRHKVFSIWSSHRYDKNKWAMAIDLNSCTGCSACMVSCQSENNVPVVGKKYVLQGREMHWIRIDRYYKGDEHNPDAVFQPVMCQHCENAPCETVCPVAATVHSDEGLNDMTYNRCVGTRYCSNNCPYKVRRFNWFFYGEHTKPLLNKALNPDVTVRTRGVMEKCTFCVQRIKEAKNEAQDENRPLKDGDIKTACQTACPADAIVFGDLNDTNSRVSQWFQSNRNYALLEEFNAAPRVRYLAKVRNTDRHIGGHGAGAGSGHGDDHKDGHEGHEGGQPESHEKAQHGETHT